VCGTTPSKGSAGERFDHRRPLRSALSRVSRGFGRIFGAAAALAERPAGLGRVWLGTQVASLSSTARSSRALIIQVLGEGNLHDEVERNATERAGRTESSSRDGDLVVPIQSNTRPQEAL